MQAPDTQIDHYIDATGLMCPQPLLALKRGIAALAAGAVVQIDTTDPHSELDFTIWCERFGHTILSHESTGEISRFVIRKSEA